MARRELRDDQWLGIRDLLPGKKSDVGRTASDNRKFIDAVLWVARTGSHWHELPPEFGKWNSIFQRYNRWSQTGVWALGEQRVEGQGGAQRVEKGRGKVALD